MQKSLILGIVFLIIAGFSGYYLSGLKTQDSPQICKPAFLDGGGPYYKPDVPFRSKIVPENTNGEKLIISGRILKNDCKTPIPDAVLDIWQANESGSYEDEWYRGRIKSDGRGNYKFETVVPKGYGEGTGYRPPHIHFKVIKDEKELITSQMFFPEVKGTPGFNDAYIMKVKSEVKNNKPIHTATHNIILP